MIDESIHVSSCNVWDGVQTDSVNLEKFFKDPPMKESQGVGVAPEDQEDEEDDDEFDRELDDMLEYLDNLSDNSNGGTRSQRASQSQSQECDVDENGPSTDEEERPSRSRKHRRYESDQSFHVEEPKAKRKPLDSEDSDDEQPRPTRESARKAFVKWTK